VSGPTAAGLADTDADQMDDTADDVGAGAPAEGDSTDGADEDEPLGTHVLLALAAAASKIEKITGEPVALDGLRTNRGALNHLLGLLTAPAGKALRTAGRTALAGNAAVPTQPDQPGTLDAHSTDAQLAAALTDPDASRAAAAAELLRRRVDTHRRAKRSQRRRRTTPTAQRTAERDRTRTDALREQRDRARTQASQATEEIRALRDQVNDLLGDVTTLTGRLEAAERRLLTARTDAHSVERLAGTLSSVLLRATTPTAPTDPADLREVASGEGGPLPARTSAPAAEQITAAITTAAERASLPVQLAEKAAVWLPKLLAALAAPPAPAQMLNQRTLTVDVLGGGTEVGGSCVLVTSGDTRLLIDAGSRPGGTEADSLKPRRIAQALDGKIDAVIVTHAHNDHAGWVPAVVAAQPHVRVLVTDATAALLSTMWVDSAKVLSRRAEELAGEDGAVPLPPYSRDDVRRATDRLHVLDVGQRFRVGQLHIELFPAGHIVGAVGVVVHAGNQRAVISGDVSRVTQSSVGGIIVPDSARGADLLVLESTYAGQGRMVPRDRVVEDFIRDVAQTVSAGGTVLVPAFALGRAQEVTLLLAEHLPEVNVLVDGLARDVCEIYSSQPGPDGELMNIFNGRIKPVPRGNTAAEITRMRPGVVVATSGMLRGGPAVAWARKILPDPRCRLTIVGYQDAESPGARLAELARVGGGEFELLSDRGAEQIPVNAAIGKYGLGAHADADDLVTISAQVNARQVMLVHGDKRGQIEFAKRLQLRSQETLLADAPWTA
jgi:Cft2 family RNA processing exonuclease